MNPPIKFSLANALNDLAAASDNFTVLMTHGDGRLLLFAFVADRVGPTPADTALAERALDAAAAALVGCGCR